MDPAEVGLTVDVAQTVARAAEQSVGPFARLYRTREVRPVVTLDAIHLHELLGDVAGEVSEAMTMPEIVFEGLEPVPVYPKPGLGLDPQQSAQAIAAAWPLLGETGLWRQPRVITIPLVEIHPVTTTEEVDRLLGGAGASGGGGAGDVAGGWGHDRHSAGGDRRQPRPVRR